MRPPVIGVVWRYQKFHPPEVIPMTTTYTATGHTFDGNPIEWHGQAEDAAAAALELRTEIAFEVMEDFGARPDAAVHLADPATIHVVDEDARRRESEAAWAAAGMVHHMDAVSAYPPELTVEWGFM